MPTGSKLVASSRGLVPLGLLFAAACSPAVETPKAAVVTVRWSKEPNSLSPLEAANQVAQEALTLLAPSLVQVDVTKRQVRPYLAAALPVESRRNDSVSVLSFQLRPEARWSDGRPVLATDVAFTFKLLCCPDLPVEPLRRGFAFVQDIELDPQDPRRFAVVCRGSSPAFALALGDRSILAEAGLDAGHRLRPYSLAQLHHLRPPMRRAFGPIAARYQALALGRHPERVPGCGPYRLVAWQANRQLQLVRRSPWWGAALTAQAPYFAAEPQAICYAILPDDNAAVLALRRGELDIYPTMPARAFARLQANPRARQQLTFHTTLTHDVVYLGFNTSRSALTDAATRRALAQFVDAASLARVSQGQQTVGLISPAEPRQYNDSLALPVYSPAAAESGLRQAGWQRGPAGWSRRGTPLALVLCYRAGDVTHELISLQLAAAARQIGVAIRLQPTEASVLGPALRNGEYDLCVQLLHGNPFRFDFRPLFSKQAIGAGNITRFSDARTEQLLTRLAVSQDTTSEWQLLRKFQVVLQQQLPVLPLFFVVNRLAVRRPLTGLHVNDLKPGYVVNTAHWEPEKKLVRAAN